MEARLSTIVGQSTNVGGSQSTNGLPDYLLSLLIDLRGAVLDLVGSFELVARRSSSAELDSRGTVHSHATPRYPGSGTVGRGVDRLRIGEGARPRYYGYLRKRLGSLVYLESSRL